MSFAMVGGAGKVASGDMCCWVLTWYLTGLRTRAHSISTLLTLELISTYAVPFYQLQKLGKGICELAMDHYFDLISIEVIAGFKVEAGVICLNTQYCVVCGIVGVALWYQGHKDYV